MSAAISERLKAAHPSCQTGHQYHARAQEQLQALADDGLSVVLAYSILLEASRF